MGCGLQERASRLQRRLGATRNAEENVPPEGSTCSPSIRPGLQKVEAEAEATPETGGSKAGWGNEQELSVI